MDGNVLERICDPGQFSLEDARKLGAALFKLDIAVPREIADLVDSRQETWPLATVRRANALLDGFRRSE